MFTLSRDEVRALDRRAIEEFGVPGVVLMENAGRGAAELLMRLNPDRKPTVILCGPGNNGGDGFVIARHLDNAGWPLRVLVFAKVANDRTPQLSADAATNYTCLHRSQLARLMYPDIWHTHTQLRDDLFDLLKTQVWIVDALFGTGLSRALAAPYDEIIAQMNATQNFVFAIDIPSGLDCDSGEPLGPTVRATHTATFVAHKRGFLNPKSREWTGEVHVIDIGAPRALVDQYRRCADAAPRP